GAERLLHVADADREQDAAAEHRDGESVGERSQSRMTRDEPHALREVGTKRRRGGPAVTAQGETGDHRGREDERRGVEEERERGWMPAKERCERHGRRDVRRSDPPEPEEGGGDRDRAIGG